jgi:hypothetical protein
VLVAVLVLGILMSGFNQILSLAMQSMSGSANVSGAVGSARTAVSRMAGFVRETGQVVRPDPDGTEDVSLILDERTLDIVDNTTLAAGRDGIPDADTDGDLLTNEGGGDEAETIEYSLDKTDSGNWKLTETVPDYTTADTGDHSAAQVICENVTDFTVQQLAAGLIRIRLTVEVQDTVQTIETRAAARLLNIQGRFP